MFIYYVILFICYRFFLSIYVLFEWIYVDLFIECVYRVCLEVGKGKLVLFFLMGVELGEGISRVFVNCL